MFWDQESSDGIEVRLSCHPSHVTRHLYYDNLICVHCGCKDSVLGGLSFVCKEEPEQRRMARVLDADPQFLNSTLGDT